MKSPRSTTAAALTVAALTIGLVPGVASADVLAGDGALLQRHIVVLQDGTDAASVAGELAGPLGLTVGTVFASALDGFTVVGIPSVVHRLTADPRVSYVEADRTFTALGEVPLGVDRVDVDRLPAAGIGTGKRTDVDVAIIDTGVDTGHRDLDVVSHVTCVSPLLFGGGSCTNGGSDDQGHGTHVAGTVGALDNGLDVVGVAPGARIWGVKVLNSLGSGSTTDIIKGIDWVTARADQIEVINMSLGGSGTSAATNDAIRRATQAGVVVVVAAGNDTANASGYTPANAPDAITVSAITDLDGKPGGLASGSCSGGDDAFATYSNFGTVVDIAAPGSCITSTRDGGGTTSMSGTSMASPHVAGASALYIATTSVARNGQRRAAVLNGLLTEWSTPQTGACGFVNGRSTERLLQVIPCGGTPPDPDPTNTAPSVAITAPSGSTTVPAGTSVTFSGTASDAEDGGLSSSIAWSSSRDGALGTGASISAVLTSGTHTVTAAVTDAAGATSTATVQVTVQADPTTNGVRVSKITYATGSFLLGGRYVDVTLTVVDHTGKAVSNATVAVDILVDGARYVSRTGATNSSGTITFMNDNTPRGCFTTTVTDVASPGAAWDGQTPANSRCV